MLEQKYKSPWRKVALSGSRTVAEVFAAAGGSPITVGFTLGAGSTIGTARVAGATASCGAWGASAVAVARLVPTSGRILGVIAKGSVNLVHAPTAGGSRTVSVVFGDSQPLGLSGQGGTSGSAYISPGSGFFIKSGSIVNPLPVAVAMQVVPSIHDGYVTVMGTKISGTTTITVQASATIEYALYNTGGFTGGNGSFFARVGGSVQFVFPVAGEDPMAVAAKNAESAIPLLDSASVIIYGNTVPWWPVGEALAYAGVWMRQRSWSDQEKRIRMEAGSGTTNAVGVIIDSTRPSAVPLTDADFGPDQFAGEDWESFNVTPAETVIDVTNFRFDFLLGGGQGFFFAVDDAGGSDSGSGGGGTGDGSGSEDQPPADGDYVRMARGGTAMWVPTKPFKCADE